MNDNNIYADSILQNKFLLENIQGGIVYSEFEPPFHLRYCTEGMAKMSGYTAEELLQLTQVDIVMEEDLPALVEDVNRQFACGDTFEVEYRLKRKDGTPLDVLDRAKAVMHEDGKKYIHCLLTDVSYLKEMERALRLNQKKYQIAIEQSGKAIIEFDAETGRLTFSENCEQIFNYPPPSGTLEEVVKSGWIVAEYVDKLINMVETVLFTATTCSMQLQILGELPKAIWCSLYLIPILEQGKMHTIIGCLENIDDEKNRMEQLTELSIKDSLTGVYNRYGIEKYIYQEMQNKSNEGLISALLILDLDYFKQINDTRGHGFGDETLIALSETVNEMLPPKTMLGRLGGDEFLIFTIMNTDIKELEELAENIVCGVRAKFASGPMKITVSVGVSWTNTCKDSFQKLYRNADKALYQTKENGRDGYTMFEYTNV